MFRKQPGHSGEKPHIQKGRTLLECEITNRTTGGGVRFRTLTEPDEEMSQYPRGTGRSQEQMAASPALLSEPAGCQPKPGGSRKWRETLEGKIEGNYWAWRAEKNMDRDHSHPMGICLHFCCADSEMNDLR